MPFTKDQCRAIAYADSTQVGFCICIRIGIHEGKHTCTCGTRWSNEEAPVEGYFNVG